MPSWKAWGQKPSGVFKGGGRSASVKVRLQKCLMKVESSVV